MKDCDLRNQNYHEKSFGPWLIAGACIAVTTVIVFSDLAADSAQLSERTQQAMVEAINDEYRARAFYTAVIQKFGAVRPFTNIVQAEDRHVQLWNWLFTQYGLSVPPDTFSDKVEAPDTLQRACQRGIEVEIANAQMYNHFLQFVQEADLRSVFSQLSQVSQNNHQPAFERCVSRTGS